MPALMIDSPQRERDLRDRLLEFTYKLHQALALAQDLERRSGTAHCDGGGASAPTPKEK